MNFVLNYTHSGIKKFYRYVAPMELAIFCAVWGTYISTDISPLSGLPIFRSYGALLHPIKKPGIVEIPGFFVDAKILFQYNFLGIYYLVILIY